MIVLFLVFLGACIFTAFVITHSKSASKLLPTWVKTLANKWEHSAAQAKARAEEQDALDKQHAKKPVCLTDEEAPTQ
jgi:hypothetical protein